MNDLSVAGIDAHMTRVAHQITRLRIGKAAHVVTLASVRRGGVRKGNAEVLIHTHNKPGTIRTVCQAGAAIHIGIADELHSVIDNCISEIAAARCGSRRRCRSCFRLLLCFLSVLLCLFFLGFFLIGSVFCNFLFCLLSRLFCRFFRFFFFCQSRFLFLFGLCFYKIRAKGNVFGRYITLTFLDVHLNPSVQFFHNG